MGSYIPSTLAERQQMLDFLGLASTEDLYSAVPEQARAGELNLPEGKSELEVAAEVGTMAKANTVFESIFRGAGAYDHYIPAIVKTVTSKEEFLTAYTPYQAEISQGVLQSIFEYQTQVCELLDMEVANASVYDGATAAAEAVFMCEERKRSGVLAAGSADPQTLGTIRTYCESRSTAMEVIPTSGYALDLDALRAKIADVACVFVQSPNYFGSIEDVDAIVAIAHEAGAKVIMATNPIAAGLLKTPGEYGVDIAVAEGQPLGMPLSFGGPYLGIMASTQKLMRKLPGRIVSQTQDADGNRAFVLTLQAREQHIRREKASSNICSNEALCAMTASVYLAAMGPAGLRQVALNSASHAHYLADELAKIPGFELQNTRPFFHEFVMSCPVDADKLCASLAEQGILAGLPVEGGILWCCTEKNSRAEIDKLVEAVKGVCA